jgi:hypothetical protein
VSSSSRVVAPALAASLALLAIGTGAPGSDLAAATYRVELFARSGLTLWDSQWYAGHWTLDYSVLFPAIGWLAGIPAMDVACVLVAAWAFDRLSVARFGRAGRAGAVAFAVGTVVQVAIGQEPYLLGEALALVALVLASGRRWPLAPLFALGSALASPLAGAFLVLVAGAWVIGCWRRRWRPGVAVVTGAFVPVALLQALFPGQGTMPFASVNFVSMLVALVPIAVIAARYDRTISLGVGLYTLALILAYMLPSAVGANVTRLGACFGVAIVVMLAPDARPGRVLLLTAAVPLALAQWIPAWPALLGDGNASTDAAYFRPLLSYLRRADHPLARAEVVPTALHWEAAYVAPYFPLARGWERQLDTVDNPIFYSSTPLSSHSYRAWLLDNGVRFVALPNVPLDYSAYAEARMLRAGVPGLRLTWHSTNWRVYAVIGAHGLLSGPARLVSANGSAIRLEVTRPGAVLVREHFVDAWQVAQGSATITEGRGGWLDVHAARAGPVTLQISL